MKRYLIQCKGWFFCCTSILRLDNYLFMTKYCHIVFYSILAYLSYFITHLTYYQILWLYRYLLTRQVIKYYIKRRSDIMQYPQDMVIIACWLCVWRNISKISTTIIQRIKYQVSIFPRTFFWRFGCSVVVFVRFARKCGFSLLNY